MSQKKISVILPLYNTEQYISEALTSITTQTVHDLEIIIINDGSTDKSLDIVQRFANTDNRILIINQIHAGVSAARNRGIEAASGKFVYFMDSDDTIQPDALEICLNRCTDHNLDFVFFDADTISESNQSNFKMNYLRTGIEEKIYNGKEILKYTLEINQYKAPVYLLFSRNDFIKSNRLNFINGIIHEDELFTFLMFMHGKRVEYIHKPLFIRRIHGSSIMTTSFSLRNINGYLTVTRELINYRKNLKRDDKLAITTADLFIRSMLNAVCFNARCMCLKDKLYFINGCAALKAIKYITFKSILTLLILKK